MGAWAPGMLHVDPPWFHIMLPKCIALYFLHTDVHWIKWMVKRFHDYLIWQNNLNDEQWDYLNNIYLNLLLTGGKANVYESPSSFPLEASGQAGPSCWIFLWSNGNHKLGLPISLCFFFFLTVLAFIGSPPPPPPHTTTTNPLVVAESLSLWALRQTTNYTVDSCLVDEL